MAANKRKQIALFASDLDGTLLGNLEATRAFSQTWESLPKDSRPLLCYNTGRLLDDTLNLIEEGVLPEPDFLICGVGTILYDYRKSASFKAFSQVLEEGWDRDKVQSIMQELYPDLESQPKYYQNKYKSSWYFEDMSEDQLKSLDERFIKEGIETHIVYSSNRDLDILPRYANKGNALVWLCKELNISRDLVLVAGDTGNDAAMMLKSGFRGVVVGNSQPELLTAVVGKPVYLSKECFADGVLEGLIHYKVIQQIHRPQSAPDTQILNAGEDDAMQHLMEEEGLAGVSSEDIEFLQLAYKKALVGLEKNITPMGFSACSLGDNETRGTDENYRSVWARDGCITILGTIRLKDKRIRETQRKTLTTLLDHVSPTGQIPANVSIDTGHPDYSGVGGICSIDSGLWVIIAFYEFVQETEDFELLRKYMPVLQRSMDWLSAHDSNNDALLEIPEAGDWTDLFGRSYNVLYDEVLWFRANICFGRLLEMIGEWQRAGDYLRWSSSIKAAIVHKFWPTTGENKADAYSFADKQSSLGDTNYLIAQVTPFDFDWRCDVYGNILAVLHNVLDVDKARIAFRFMWGVGVNEPFPVANLYPAVQAGDPGWRNYYTVNLLNLPHHYHNGGIWPFVGAQWVRFIHRIGLRDVALNELIRLARLNQRGIHNEWEFNEWAHGQTGKPMGKAYQAWSCSEFIAAVHDLRILKSGKKK